MDKIQVICMTESVWKNSYLSIARHYGGCKFNGHEYKILNEEGKDLVQCSIEADEKGWQYAIPPGFPADLVRADFIPYYRKLGRNKFIEVLEHNQHTPEKELKEIYNELIKSK